MKAVIDMEVFDIDTIDTFVGMLKEELKTHFGDPVPRSNVIYTRTGNMSLNIHNSINMPSPTRGMCLSVRYGDTV